MVTGIGKRVLRPAAAPVHLVALLLGLLLSSVAHAFDPGPEAEAECKQILHTIHENTEATYREMQKMPREEAQAYLVAYVERSLRKYVDLESTARRAFRRDWDAVEQAGRQDAAIKGAIYEMRTNLHTSFDAFERGARLKLLRIRSRVSGQVWISGVVGSTSPGPGQLPFSFITMFKPGKDAWLIDDMVFLNASMVEFARSNVEHKIDRLGLEAALDEYDALVDD